MITAVLRMVVEWQTAALCPPHKNRKYFEIHYGPFILLDCTLYNVQHVLLWRFVYGLRLGLCQMPLFI